MRRNTMTQSFVIITLIMLSLPALSVSASVDTQIKVNVTASKRVNVDEAVIAETDGEPTLQEWFDANGYTINVTGDELGIEVFNAGYYQIAILAEIAGYAPSNNLSWYPVSSGELHLIFSGVNITGDSTIFEATETFGLCLDSPDGLFYTETNRSSDGFDHALIFANPKPPGGYIIVWEDLWEGGDTDFQDLILAMLVPVIEAEVYIYPCTLNLKSRGRWITCLIKLPRDYDVEDIDVSTIKLNGTISAESKPVAIFYLDEFDDYDECNDIDYLDDSDDHEGAKVLMVKFVRATVIEYIINAIAGDGIPSSKWTYVTLTVSGNLFNGQTFEGNTGIRIIHFPRDTVLVKPPFRAKLHKRGGFNVSPFRSFPS